MGLRNTCCAIQGRRFGLDSTIRASDGCLREGLGEKKAINRVSLQAFAIWNTFIDSTSA